MYIWINTNSSFFLSFHAHAVCITNIKNFENQQWRAGVRQKALEKEANMEADEIVDTA